MNLVIPMAGNGSRFAAAGFTRPKPLIEVRGRPMYTWAVESLPLALAKRIVFVCLAEHLADGSLERDIRARYAAYDPTIVALDAVTQGQACTVLTARAWIDGDDALIIYNADTLCRTDLAARLPALPRACDGVIGVFEAPGDHWSFARTAPDSDRVLETAEKRRISPWATTGLYHFTRGRDFVRHADAAIAADDRVRGEFYVAPLYNRLIADGADIRIAIASEVRSMGTPDELAVFEATYPG